MMKSEKIHPLYQYIDRYASTLLTEADFKLMLSHFIQKTLSKKQYFLQEGEQCKYFAFILNGAMRQYYVDEKGVEHVVHLYIEDWWAGDRESFVLGTPSQYHIDAWEDCELLLITRASVLELTKQFPAFNEMQLKLDERNNITTQRRVTSSISFTAEKRYADFVECHPYFVSRFPQHIIASYLGITKETLSRVRKKSLKK